VPDQSDRRVFARELFDYRDAVIGRCVINDDDLVWRLTLLDERMYRPRQPSCVIEIWYQDGERHQLILAIRLIGFNSSKQI